MHSWVSLSRCVSVAADLVARSIYHRLEWPYAEQIFSNRRLRLSPVESWQDPYERWWLDRVEKIWPVGAMPGAYGMCWTRSYLDEPAWRAVGFNKTHPIVRIKCSIRALVSTLSAAEDHSIQFFLANVRYRPESTLGLLAEGFHRPSRVRVASLLAYKRNAFQSEKEVRLLALTLDKAENEVFIPIEPKELISQVMISPHASEEQAQEIKAKVAPYGIQCVRSSVLSPTTR